MAQAASLFAVAVVLAVVVEAVIEYLKELLSKKITTEQVVAIIFGLLLAFGAGLDVFRLLEIDFGIPYLGTVIMGLFISRGSGWVHDIFDKLLKAKEGQVPQQTTQGGQTA